MAELAYMQVARVCNQKCIFCSNPANGRVISWDEAVELTDAFAAQGAAGIILTGGEPTLFPELAKLVTYAEDKGLPTRLITNGQKTADFKYLKSLYAAGLRHTHISVHSHKVRAQAAFSRNPESLANISRSLDNAAKLGMSVTINSTINKLNAPYLSELVKWIVTNWPFVRHFVWNNLDPLMNNVEVDSKLVHRLRDMEVELHRAMTFLDSTGRTFRAERVPLCYMSEFPHCSTETRKFVKDEVRSIYFLDKKGLRNQTKQAWSYGKCDRCKTCSLDPICAGLYQMDIHYSSEELCPMLTSPEDVARRVLEDEDG